MDGFGAFILGRNIFGPVRGEWPDDQWKGWWGDNPPYHASTFVLTHYPRAPIEMLGGATFHFISDGIESALQKARETAGAQDIKIGGGVETDRYWNAIVGNDGSASACGWCKDRWGLSWQITPRALTDTLAQGGDGARRAFAAMMEMGKIDIARIEAAVRA